jgi:hypothetical protein
MKYINKTIVLIFLLASISGCKKDLLNKSPLDALSPETFYKTEPEVKIGLAGVYNGLRENPTSIHWYQFDFMSDDAFCEHAWQGSLEFGAWKQNSSSATAFDKWARAYSTIVRANKFMKNLETAPVSDEIKKQMTAEARFIRAFMYADLIHFYGDVPLILAEQTLEEAQVPRTSKNEVLNAILQDLDFAAQNLPTKYSGSDVGRVTKGAALAYKARVYLYNQKWAEAAAAAKSVMDLGIYQLVPNYESIFLEENENNVEVIFDIQYIRDLAPQPWPTAALSFAEWPTPSVTASLINSYYMKNGLPVEKANSGYDAQNPFNNRDPRMTASIILPGSQMGARKMIPATDDVLTGARPRKYADLNIANRNNSAINTILMRYADILLMRAEALVEANSLTQEVYNLINLVRARTSMPSVESVEGTALSQSQLRAIIRHERRVEFTFEGLRYADMYRWKDVSLVHDVYGYNRAKLSNPSSPSTWVYEQVLASNRTFDAQKGWLWPIPQVELQTNKKIIPQNPGY